MSFNVVETKIVGIFVVSDLVFRVVVLEIELTVVKFLKFLHEKLKYIFVFELKLKIKFCLQTYCTYMTIMVRNYNVV